jgi:hypothetical protein
LFIKAHVRGGYRAAALYLNDQGKNEKCRLVTISDPDARNLDEAFHNMWLVASATKAEKPLFHFSINPFKDERLTDKQVKKIAKAYTAKCGMDISCHQHVIVEHIKDGRQHFHIMMNRVSDSGKAIDPGLYKKKARECAREMEIELGLRRLVPLDKKRTAPSKVRKKIDRVTRGKTHRSYSATSPLPVARMARSISKKTNSAPTPKARKRRKYTANYVRPTRPASLLSHDERMQELLIWAWENKRTDILYTFGIILPPDFEF